jgi:hypothetical protein
MLTPANKWQFVRPGCKILDNGKRKIADVCSSYASEEILQMRGHLLAAAPDLYAALKLAEQELSGSPVLETVRAALAKADETDA